MSDDLNEIQTKIALLEKDAKTGEQIHKTRNSDRQTI